MSSKQINEINKLLRLSEEELLRKFYDEDNAHSTTLDSFPPDVQELRRRFAKWEEKAREVICVSKVAKLVAENASEAELIAVIADLFGGGGNINAICLSVKIGIKRLCPELAKSKS